MKCSELLRILFADGWFVVSQRGLHIKLKHGRKKATLIFPDHGFREVGKGLASKILKTAGIK